MWHSAVILAAVCRVAALRLPRRALMAGLIAQPCVAEVPVDPFNSMCLGFGCNAVRGVEQNTGAPKPLDEDSIDWQTFLGLVDAKGVKRVEFGDVNMTKAWAVLDGDKRVLIGEGYPLDQGDTWSSPLFVARILQNNNIKYSFIADLKRRSPS